MEASQVLLARLRRVFQVAWGRPQMPLFRASARGLEGAGRLRWVGQEALALSVDHLAQARNLITSAMFKRSTPWMNFGGWGYAALKLPFRHLGIRQVCDGTQPNHNARTCVEESETYFLCLIHFLPIKPGAFPFPRPIQDHFQACFTVYFSQSFRSM
jgi:hypothetical protein